MDPATLAGIGLAIAIVFVSMIMEGGNPAAMFLVPPMLLVFVGTIGAVMAGGLLKDALSIPKLIQKALLAKPAAPGDLVSTVVSLAEKARKEGLLALEDATKTVDNQFLKNGLQMAIDGTDPEEVRDILEAEIDVKRKGDKRDSKIFADMGGYAPTVGIIGTVLGLIHVLENLSEPDKLGHLIAGAFVATLWGVLTANLIWLPISNRIKRLSEHECAQMELVVEGVSAIQSGVNPRVVAQKLKSLMPDEGSGKEEKAA